MTGRTAYCIIQRKHKKLLLDVWDVNVFIYAGI
jgi:hypothetical protein